MMDSEKMDQDNFEVTEIWNYKNLEAMQLAVVQKLRLAGLAVPRGQGVEHQLEQRHKGSSKSLKSLFGKELSNQPSSPCQYGCHTFHLPRVFVMLVEHLEEQVCTKGLFRKAGSISRQRSLKAGLENSNPSLPADTNPHDLAGLLKQFLRQLPSYLLPAHLSGLLEACVTLIPAREQTQSLLLVCLLLPPLHLQCLCVLMRLLALVAEGAGHSFMDASNLAVVMAPNLMETQGNNILDINNNPLKIPTTIVRLLIENASMLGTVPRDVAVLADNLGSKLRMTKAASLDDLDDNPLPEKEDGKKLKQRTSTISGLVMGLGNRLRRQKRKGSAEFNLLHPKKRTKTCEDLLEQDQLRPASSTSASGTWFSPLLQTSQKYNFSNPKAIKFSFSPWRSSFPNSPDITSPCLLHSLTSTSSPSLLHNDIHSSVNPSQLNSEAAIVASNSIAYSASPARESSLEISPTANRLDTGMDDEEGVVLDREGGVALNGHDPECVRMMGGVRNGCHWDAVMSEWVSDTNAPSLPCTPMQHEDEKMMEEQQVESGGHYPRLSQGSESNSSTHSVPMTTVGYAHQHYDNAHYSATLGMSMLDLPRRTLRDHRNGGISFTPTFKPSSIPTGGQEQMDGDQWEGGEDLGGAHCSSTSLSASLGITSLKPNSRAVGLRRLQCRNRMRQKQCPLRANLKANWTAAHTHDSSLKSCDHDVKSSDFGSPVPLPPLKMAGDDGGTITRPPSQSGREDDGNGSTGGTLGSGVALGNGLGSVRDGLPQQPLGFNSSSGKWSGRSGLGYTLLRDGDSHLRRHPLPCVMAGPGGLHARGDMGCTPKSPSTPLHANFLSLPTEASN